MSIASFLPVVPSNKSKYIFRFAHKVTVRSRYHIRQPDLSGKVYQVLKLVVFVLSSCNNFYCKFGIQLRKPISLYHNVTHKTKLC
jgi:hypothetical protein